MTPKEKAKDLYLQMLSWQSECLKFIERNIISTAAKKCALIAVVEVMCEVTDEDDFSWWNKVKQEIELL